MKNKILMLIILLSVIYTGKVSASCSSKELADMSKLTNNVIFTPVFNENTKDFDLIISNLSPMIYFYDLSSQINYKNTNQEMTLTNIKPNSSYRFKFYSSNSNCLNAPLSSKYVNIPGYNPYYQRKECVGYENYKPCQKFVNYSYTEDVFIRELNRLKEKNNEKTAETEGEVYKGFYEKLFDFYVENYMFILPILIIVLVIGIVLKLKKAKKEELF